MLRGQPIEGRAAPLLLRLPNRAMHVVAHRNARAVGSRKYLFSGNHALVFGCFHNYLDLTKYLL